MLENNRTFSEISFELLLQATNMLKKLTKMWWVCGILILPVSCLGSRLPSTEFIKDFAESHQLANVLYSFESVPTYQSVEW